MSYLQRNNKLLSDGGEGELLGDGGGETPSTDFQTPGGPQDVTGPGQGQGVVNPGSVGGSTSAGGAGFTPSWVNIQSYLNAAPAKSGVVQGFEDTSKEVAGQARSDINKFQSETLDPYSDLQNQYSQMSFDPMKLLSQQRAQMAGKPIGNYADEVGMTDQFLDNQFDLTFEPVQRSEQFKNLQGALDDRDNFSNFISDQYDDLAGRQLTPGEFDLQRQIDMSRGALGQARDYALEQMSGLDAQYNQVNEGLEDKYNQFNTMRDRTRQFKNQLMSSPELYLRKLAENRWNPMTQRQGEQQFFQGVVNPARDATRRAFDEILRVEYQQGKNPDYRANHETILRARPDMRPAYEGIMRGNYGNNADQVQNWINQMGGILRGTNSYSGFGNQLQRAWNDYMKNADNQQNYRETFF